MLYRIRYQQGQSQENEMKVEAHSPAEAITKFQCARSARDDNRNPSRVTSVQAETDCECSRW